MSKGSKPRPRDTKKWDEAPYWKALADRQKKSEGTGMRIMTLPDVSA